MMAHLQRDSLVDQLKPGSRDVIGSDDRKRVSDATQLPFRWVCQVLGEDTDTRRLSVGSGFSIGVVPWESVDPNLLVGLKGAISGYPRYEPGEKEKENSPINAHQCYDIASLTQSGGQLFYTADTSAGQSGCPVLVARPSPSTGELESTAVGVHIRGVESSLGNQAVPFHSELTEFIQTQLSTFESRSSA